MKRTHPAFWGAGWAGLFVGALLAVLALLDGSETAQLAGGYGLLMAGAAVYLLGGLGLRQTIVTRRMRHSETSVRVGAGGAPAPSSPQS
jgi:hypothetical protein